MDFFQGLFTMILGAGAMWGLSLIDTVHNFLYGWL